MARTYNAAKLLILVGNRQITGLADGDDVVQVHMNSDEVDLTVGATGEAAFSVNNDRSGEITIKLLSTSPDNAYMQSLLSAQRLADQLNTSITIKDLNGTDLYFSPFSRIAKAPDRGWGAKAGAIEWRFKCAKITGTAGGNL